MPDQPRLLKQLSVPESLRLLGTVSLGRIVFTDHALPAIRPVNHILDAQDVVIRSHLGASVVAAARLGVVVAYEADTIDPTDHVGWSVIVTGTATLVIDPDEIARYQRLLRPWVDGPAMEQVIRIRSDLITGFELLPATPHSGAGEQAVPAS